MIVSAVGRFLIRRFGRSTIEQAGRDLEHATRQRLPAPVARVVPALPPEVVQLGGSALVAGRAAKGAVATTRRAGRLATGATNRTTAGIGAVSSAVGRGRNLAGGARAQLGDEVERSRRRLRADYLAATVGPDAATDALLDVRPDGLDLEHESDQLQPGEPADPHGSVPDPVAPGRYRRRRRPPALVGRMRRGYRPPARPWD